MGLGNDAARDGRTPDARRSASDYVTGRVMDMVREQSLQPGDRLPSVQVLARTFQVAQPTMRESLRRLQAVGIVEIRHGSGIYLKRHGHVLVLPNPHPGELSSRTIFDLFDARIVIEPHLARLATETMTDAEVATLADTLEQAGSNLQSGDAILADLNLDFHRMVARCSGSAVLAQVIDSLLDVYRIEQLMVMRVYDDRLRDHNSHLHILKALADRRPKLAERRMRAHLEDVRDVLEARTATAPEAATAHVISGT
ncbi:MAG: FadR family transcriptional regulator [Microlunatus sp.]|nr:FadR family transcriptional regulator [Microlunatus sp.]